MTCREKLKLGHPGLVDDGLGARGIPGCPSDFGLMDDPDYCLFGKTGISYKHKHYACERCWDREIPEVEKEEPETAPSEPSEITEPANEKSHIPTMTDLQWLMRKALGYPGIAVSITFMDDAITFNAYPYPTQEEETDESH